MKTRDSGKKAWKIGYAVAAFLAVACVVTGGGARNAKAKAAAERTAWAEKSRLAQQTLEASQMQPVSGDGGAAAVPAKSATKAATLGETMDEQLDRDANLQVKLIRIRRAGTLLRYGAFLREKKLSAAEIEKLGDAWEVYEAARLDAEAISRTMKLAPGDTAVREQREQARREMIAVEKAVLGEQGHAEFTRFKRLQPFRTGVAVYTGKASLLGMPLTVEQGLLVTEVLAEADPNYRTFGGVDERRLDWAGGLENARRFLSAEQHELLVAEMNVRRTEAMFFKTIEPIVAEMRSARAKQGNE